MKEIETLDQAISHWSRLNPSKKIIISERNKENISYLQFDNLVNSFCNKYIKTICKDDICILYLEDSIVCLAIIHSIFRLGGILLPIDSEMGETTQRNIIEHSGSNLIFASMSNRNSERLSLEFRDQIKIFNNNLSSQVDFLKNKKRFASVSTKNSVAIIAYTSGTTSNPKGVILTHSNLIAAYVSASNHLSSPNVIGCVFRIATLGTLGIHFFYANINGSTTVLLPKLNILNAKNFWSNITKYNVDFIYLVPSLIKLLNHISKNTSKIPLSFLVVSAGSSLPESEQNIFQTKFGVVLRNIYGLTESSFAVFYGRELKGKGMNDIGKPLSIEAKIVDNNGISVEKGSIGELVYKGDMVAKSYFNNSLESAKVFLKDGWLATGDLAKESQEGNISIVGRKKDLVIRGGFNIFPAEVEEIIINQKGVVDTAVFGMHNSIMGEELLAFVQTSNSNFDSNLFINQINKELGRYRSPDRYIFTKEPIPLNSSGKVDRNSLEKLFSVSSS